MPQIRAGKGKIRVFAGPDLIIILGDIKIEEEVGGFHVSVDIEPDNLVLFGIKGGIGYAQPLDKGDFVFDCCYTKSFTEIFKDDNTSINGLTLTVGYQIGL